MRAFRVAIPVSNLDRLWRFYETVLEVDADETVPSRLYFHCGDVILAIIDWRVEPLGPFRPTPENLYFVTDDVDRAHERATTVGAEHLTPVGTRPWGERSFYCADPDGNLLCFVDESTLFLGRGADWS